MNWTLRRLFDRTFSGPSDVNGFTVQNNAANGLICTGESVTSRRFCEGYQTVFHSSTVLGYGSEQRVIDVDGDQEPGCSFPICGRGEGSAATTRKFTGGARMSCVP